MQISRRLTLSLAAAVTGLLAFASSASAGPVNYLSQDRGIEARLNEVYTRPDDPAVSRQDIRTSIAPNLGRFDASVTASIQDPPFGAATGEMTVSQRSTLADDGINITGSYSGFTATELGRYGFRSHADVTFQITGEMEYALSYSLEIAFFTEANESKLGLMRVGGSGNVVFDEVLNFTGHVGDNPASIGSRTGFLAAGTYRFEFLHAAGTDVSNDGNYAVSLSLSSSDHGGPHPIPLPPGAWAAIVTAGGFIVAGNAVRLARRG